MSAMNVIDRSKNVVKNYKSDLEHDRKWIQENPNKPFLHKAYENGSHMIFLVSPDEYPAAGEYVPYLFGKSERNHIVEQVAIMAECLTGMTHRYKDEQYHHFDGKTLHRVTPERFVEIARQHVATTKKAWKSHTETSA